MIGVSPSDERTLVEGIAAGDPEAISEFLERTHHPVYCMAARLASDPETRRDWSHDVLLGILEDLERGRYEYRGPGSFWAWFRKRAHFRLLDAYRSSRLTSERERAAGAPQDLPTGSHASLSAAWAGWGGRGQTDPAEEMERIEVQSAVERCLRGLTNDDHRKSLELLLFHDLAYEEIARRSDVPLNTVRAWIRRGRLALRRCLVLALHLAPGAQLPAADDPSSSRGRPEA